jgi:Zn-dependent protease with chaperone function
MAFKSLADNLETTGKKAEEYLTNTAEYYKLRLFKSSMKFATSLVNMLLLSGAGLFVLSFFSVGLAIVIGNALESTASGFFIVGGIYSVVLILILLFGKDIIVKSLLYRFSELLADDEDLLPKDKVEQNLIDESEDELKEEP